MASSEDGETLGKWRRARSEEDQGQVASFKDNLRLLAVCAGTLTLLAFVISSVQGISSAHSASVHASIGNNRLLDDISNSTLGVSDKQLPTVKTDLICVSLRRSL